MKKNILLLVCCALLLLSCKESVDYKKSLEGSWVCSTINNLYIPTDNMLVLNFDANGAVVYSQGIGKDASHSEFISAVMNYQIDEQFFTVKGILASRDSVDMRFEIVSISEDKMIANLVAANNSAAVGRTPGKYIFSKIAAPAKNLNAIQGEWEGYKHVRGEFDTLASVKMKFEGENNYVYSKLFNGNWGDCQGSFSLYGDNMAVNYATDVSSYYDCWEIVSINAQEMMLRKYMPQSDSSSIMSVLRYKMIKL